MADTPTDGLMTPHQAADHLKVKVGTIRQWAKRGEIPHRKVRSLLRFDRDELDQWTKPEGE